MGYMDVMAWKNMLSPSVNFQARPSARDHIELWYTNMNLASSQDCWYRAAQNCYVFSNANNTKKHIGDEIDVSWTRMFAGGKVAFHATYGTWFSSGYLTSTLNQQVNQHWENLFATHTSGVDFSVKGSTQILPGLRYSTDFDATWTMQYRVYSSSRPNAQGGTGAWGDNLVRRYGYPEWQLNWVHTFTTGMLTNSLRWTHSSSQRLQGDWDDSTWDANDCVDQGYNDYQCKISAYNRWDWDVSINPVKGLSIGAHVFNVFRQRPPVDNRGWDGISPASTEDAAGRQLKLWASYKF